VAVVDSEADSAVDAELDADTDGDCDDVADTLLEMGEPDADAEPVSLADVCEHLGVSARALQLAFRQHTGETPMAYLRNIRLDQIHDRLRHAKPGESMSVSQLAADYGFLHLGHFAGHYQARFGELPNQTRKALDVRGH